MDVEGAAPFLVPHLWSAGAAGSIVAAAVALLALRATRGTTALPAAAWALAAALFLALDALLRARGIVTQPAAAAGMRLVGVVLSVSPALSLLGAKRPQHGVWQFIVAALAAVVLFPAAAGALVRPGSVPEVHLLARLLLGALLALGWMNALGTSRAIPATLLTLGVVILARGFLPGVDTETSFPPSAAIGARNAAILDCLGAWIVAAGAVAGVVHRPRPFLPDAASNTFAGRIDPAWRSLRDTIGAAWSLRIAERFDQLAEAHGWPCRLRLAGVHPRDAPGEGPWQRDARRALEALLRRFVSPSWLVRHGWPPGGSETGGDSPGTLADDRLHGPPKGGIGR